MLVKRVVIENKTLDADKYFIVSGFFDRELNDALAFEELTQMSSMLQQAILDRDCNLEYKSDIVLFMDIDSEDEEDKNPTYH